jgi:hypothetical protein
MPSSVVLTLRKTAKGEAAPVGGDAKVGQPPANDPCSNADPWGLDSCNFNIGINNKAGVNLSGVESQINSVLGAVASTNGDTVGANFVFSGKPDYTLNIVNGNVNGNSGWQTSFLFFQFAPNVNAAAIQAGFPNQSSTVMGTVAVHELTHRITQIGDVKYYGDSSGTPNLMQIDSFVKQFPNSAYNLMANPSGLLLSPGQVSALFTKCQKARGKNGNGGGSGNAGLYGGNGPGWDGGLADFLSWGASIGAYFYELK